MIIVCSRVGGLKCGFSVVVSFLVMFSCMLSLIRFVVCSGLIGCW